MGLGEYAVTSILDSPESQPIEIRNVSEVTWEDGSKDESITTSSTNAIIQDRTENDFFHLSGSKTDIDAVAYIDPNEEIKVRDRIYQSDRDTEFEILNFESRSGYKMAELKEVL